MNILDRVRAEIAAQPQVKSERRRPNLIGLFDGYYPPQQPNDVHDEQRHFRDHDLEII